MHAVENWQLSLGVSLHVYVWICECSVQSAETGSQITAIQTGNLWMDVFLQFRFWPWVILFTVSDANWAWRITFTRYAESISIIKALSTISTTGRWSYLTGKCGCQPHWRLKCNRSKWMSRQDCRTSIIITAGNGSPQEVTQEHRQKLLKLEHGRRTRIRSINCNKKIIT